MNLSLNTYSNSLLFNECGQNEAVYPIQSVDTQLSEAGYSSPIDSHSFESVTLDCLKIPLRYLSLESLESLEPCDDTGFYALAQNIFQFSIVDRERVYSLLKIDEWKKDHLEYLIDSDPSKFQKTLSDYIQLLAASIKIEKHENVLIEIADLMGINLIVVHEYKAKVKVVADSFSTAICHEEDHPCFGSLICSIISEKIGLFKKRDGGEIQIDCNSESAMKVREVSQELRRIKKNLLNGCDNHKIQHELSQMPYQEWSRQFVKDEILDIKAAFAEVTLAQKALRDFSEEILKPELKKHPLAIIKKVSEISNNNSDDEKKSTAYAAINLKKLNVSALEAYEALVFSNALQDILEFLDQRKKGINQFSILCEGHSSDEILSYYDGVLNKISESIGAQEILSINDEQIVEKINLLAWSLQSSLPVDLKNQEDFSVDPRFETLRDVAKFIQKKAVIEKLSHQIGGKRLSEIKAILRATGVFQDFDQVAFIAKQLGERPKEINAILFREFYGAEYQAELDAKKLLLEKICQLTVPKKQWSIEDDNILDEINLFLLSHSLEKKQEQEKSLVQLCREYSELNGLKPSEAEAVMSQILNIRLAIKDLKKGIRLPDDIGQQKPFNLIAEICVKIESSFGEMLRDSQLLAILSMLDSSNHKGILSEVKTGEGKSYIIAALAIIKIKQGNEVDIITSSSTLAKRDLEKFQDFYQKHFGIKADHNCNLDAGMMANSCYQQNSIVYGTAASFEGDSLRSEFYQADTFNGRSRGIAIVDEADSALLDKSSWLCQISDSVAGMSTVRPLLYYIWAMVLKNIENAVELNFQKKEDFDVFLLKIKRGIIENAKDFFSGGNKSFMIPEHLREFVDYRISYWVESALNAVIYSNKKEYSFCRVQKKIIPIDFANTGEWEHNVQWEDGLHQFLQMKNGVGLETETITKSFMSNFTLINKYKSIYGLSGTLGGVEEAEVLKKLYGVETRKIPTFKTSNYAEMPAWMSVDKTQWLNSLYTDVVQDGLKNDSCSEDTLPSKHTKRSRASLIICKTIADVEEVEAYFKLKGLNPNDIVTYTEGEKDKEKINEATAGKIIIATNLSGRGTNINAVSIEDAGGMHVIFSFLPENSRIQKQGFGRTARNGFSGTARLIINHDEIKDYHLEKTEKPLLNLCNSTFENLKGTKIKTEGEVWQVESDIINDTYRELKIRSNENSQKTKMIRVMYSAHSGTYLNNHLQKTYNKIEVDGTLVASPDSLQCLSFNLTYDSIMKGRDQRELARLKRLANDEKGSLIQKHALFEEFKIKVHNISQHVKINFRLNDIKDSLLNLYKSYILDEWAIFLDCVNKNLKEPRLKFFDYAENLEGMINKNDLYKMQYMNAIIDVAHPDVLKEADAFYAVRGRKIDLTGGFACYNRVFVTLKNNHCNVEEAKTYLNQAKEIFDRAEEHEKGILHIQHKMCPCDDFQPETMEGNAMLRLILTMKALIKRNLEELEKLKGDYSKLKVSFASPFDLKEKSTCPSEKKDDDTTGYTIPEDLMQEAIKLGLKGPLKLEGEGDLWKAIVCASVCVLIAVAVIAMIALSGGAAAPLVALLGGKIAFGVLSGAVAGAAISGAINAIKGAVNGDFSAKNFGKDVATGLITGAIGGGVCAGLSGAAAGVLQTAATLTRVGVNAGIGAASGVVAGGTGYLVGSKLHGKEITWQGLGKAVLQGAVGGALGGGFVGLAPHGSASIRWAMLTGTLGSTSGNACIQGIQIAMGDRKDFDALELLENGLQGGVQAGIMASAQKYAANQAFKQNQRIVPTQHSQENGQNNHADLMSKIEARITSCVNPNERIVALNRLNKLRVRQGLAPKTLNDFGDLSHLNDRYQQNRQQRNREVEVAEAQPHLAETGLRPADARLRSPPAAMPAAPSHQQQSSLESSPQNLHTKQLKTLPNKNHKNQSSGFGNKGPFIPTKRSDKIVFIRKPYSKEKSLKIFAQQEQLERFQVLQEKSKQQLQEQLKGAVDSTKHRIYQMDKNGITPPSKAFGEIKIYDSPQMALDEIRQKIDAMEGKKPAVYAVLQDKDGRCISTASAKQDKHLELVQKMSIEQIKALDLIPYEGRGNGHGYCAEQSAVINAIYLEKRNQFCLKGAKITAFNQKNHKPIPACATCKHTNDLFGFHDTTESSQNIA